MKAISLINLALCAMCVIADIKIPKINTRILGGKNAENGQFPYTVSLRLKGKHICGGVIINEWYVCEYKQKYMRNVQKYL